VVAVRRRSVARWSGACDAGRGWDRSGRGGGRRIGVRHGRAADGSVRGAGAGCSRGCAAWRRPTLRLSRIGKRSRGDSSRWCPGRIPCRSARLTAVRQRSFRRWAVAGTHRVLQRRAGYEAASVLLPILRALEDVAAIVRRQVRRGGVRESSFEAQGALASELARHFSGGPGTRRCRERARVPGQGRVGGGEYWGERW